MSSYGITVPSPEEHDYHEAHQVQRVEAARKLIQPSDVLALIDSRIAAESDPTQHPLYQLTLFLLDRQVAVDGAQLYNDLRQRVLMAIDTCLDDLLEMED